MENASKALIIAGAILLSILIIALGVYVFNIARGAMDTSAIDELAVSTFNRPYEDYEGTCIGSQVKQLISKVVAGVKTNKGSEEKLPNIVYFDKSATGGTPSNLIKSMVPEDPSDPKPLKVEDMNRLRNKISESHYYYVAFHYNIETGLIDCVAIYYKEPSDEIEFAEDWYNDGAGAGGGEAES